MTIGAAGGTIELPGKVQIEIPAGALSADVMFSITETDTPVTVPDTIGLLSNVIVLGPDNVTFTRPVTVRFKYSAAQSVVSSPKTSAGVVLLRRQGMQEFLPVASAGVGSTEVVAQTTHLSDWLVALIAGVGCTAADNACTDNACDPAMAPNGCPSACSYSTDEGGKQLHCVVTARSVTPTYNCSCMGGGVSESFTLPDLTIGGPVAAFLANRCGFGCEGRDAGLPDAAPMNPDSGVAQKECVRYDDDEDPNTFPGQGLFIRTIQVFDGRVWWSTDEPGSNRIHSETLALTDHRSLPNQTNVRALGTNGVKLLWNNANTMAGGLYEITTTNSTPNRLSAGRNGAFAVFASDTHVFSTVFNMGSSDLYRANIDGTNEVRFLSGTGTTFRLDGSGQLYIGHPSTTAATMFGCPGTPAPFFTRRPADGTSMTVPENLVNGCDALTLTGRIEVIQSRFTIDDTNLYFTTGHGDLFAYPLAGGPLRLMFRGAEMTNGGSEIVTIGADVYWINRTLGLVKLPKTAQPPMAPTVLEASETVFRELTVSSSHIYWATYETLCRVRVN